MALLDAWGYDGKTYDGKEMRLKIAALTGGRSGVSTIAGFKGTPNGTPDDKVQIAAGTAIIPATTAGLLGSWEVPNDAVLQSPGIAPTAAQGRWDKFLLQVLAGIPTIVIKQGTPAGSPAYPSLAAEADYIELFGVKMPASKSIIDNGANGVIEDFRGLWPQYVICTSTTRPAVPFVGQRIYETDTDTEYRWSGSVWVPTTAFPWLIDIDPINQAVSHVNWDTITLSASTIYGGAKESTSTSNPTAALNFDVVLGAGTWTFRLLHHKANDIGTYNFQLDGVTVGTIDGYNGTASLNQRGAITGIAVATSGKKRLKLIMATKNVNSSAYRGSIGQVTLQRTV